MTIGKINIHKDYINLLIINLVLLITIVSSPIINVVIEDPSIFLIVGKAMKDGLILYKEVTDHKGIYLFFMYYIASLISDNSAIGILVISGLLSYVWTIVIYKITMLLTNENRKNSFITAVLMCCFFNLAELTQFGLYSEFFALVSYSISVYYYIKYKNNNHEMHDKRYAFIYGISIAFTFNIKLNYVIIYIPFLVDILYNLIKYKQYSNIKDSIKSGFIGLLLGHVPAWTYCILNDCLSDMYYRTIIENVIYTTNKSGLDNLLYILIYNLSNPLLIFIHLSMIVTIHLIKDKRQKITYIFTVILNLFILVQSGRIANHYIITCYILMLPFVIRLTKAINIGICMLILVITFIWNYTYNFSNILPISDEYNYMYEQINLNYADSKKLFIGYSNGIQLYTDTDIDKFPSLPCVQYSVNSESVDYKIDKINSNEYDVVILSEYKVEKECGKEALELLIKTIECNNYILDNTYKSYKIYVKQL